MRLRAVVVLGLIVAACQAPSAIAGPATRLPVGETDGVRISQNDDGTLRVVFTKRAAKLYRKIAGKVISISCVDMADSSSGIESYRAPRRRSSFIYSDTEGSRYDYCRVWRGSARGVLPLVSVPLKQAGAVFLDEQENAFGLFRLLALAGEFGGDPETGEYPTWDEVVAGLPGGAKTASTLNWVPLEAPGDSPAAGQFGYWSDGVHHVVAVTVSATGRRLFIEYEADDVFHTNVSSYLFNLFAGEID